MCPSPPSVHTPAQAGLRASMAGPGARGDMEAPAEGRWSGGRASSAGAGSPWCCAVCCWLGKAQVAEVRKGPGLPSRAGASSPCCTGHPREHCESVAHTRIPLRHRGNRLQRTWGHACPAPWSQSCTLRVQDKQTPSRLFRRLGPKGPPSPRAGGFIPLTSLVTTSSVVPQEISDVLKNREINNIVPKCPLPPWGPLTRCWPGCSGLRSQGFQCSAGSGTMPPPQGQDTPRLCRASRACEPRAWGRRVLSALGSHTAGVRGHIHLGPEGRPGPA